MVHKMSPWKVSKWSVHKKCQKMFTNSVHKIVDKKCPQKVSAKCVHWAAQHPVGEDDILTLPWIAFHCSARHCTVLQNTVLHWTELYCTTLHCTAIQHTPLSCLVLNCIAEHCTALHFLKNKQRKQTNIVATYSWISTTLPLPNRLEWCSQSRKTKQCYMKNGQVLVSFGYTGSIKLLLDIKVKK